MEYQAKELFAKHGVPVLPGETVDTAEAGPRRRRADRQAGRRQAQVKTGGAARPAA
jgi:succinyl-CoA synthetase beta subunit